MQALIESPQTGFFIEKQFLNSKNISAAGWLFGSMKSSMQATEPKVQFCKNLLTTECSPLKPWWTKWYFSDKWETY